MRDRRSGGDIEEVPEWARERAKAARSLHDPDTPVLDLVFDSVLDEPTSTGVRTLRFGSADDVAVTASITREPRGLQVVVDISPATHYDIEIVHPTDPPSVAETDVAGHARISGLPAALTSMRICPRGGRPAAARRTAWVPF